MVPAPGIQEIEAARTAFEAREPRDLFYRAATALVTLALEGKTSLSIAEASAVLLQTWNQQFYRRRKFDSQHFAAIERLISDHHSTLIALRQRSIESLNQEDETEIARVFKAFEEVLGPVGAAKCLHLLAPCFFPLWDNKIAKAYGVPLGPRGTNSAKYLSFMKITKRQCEDLRRKPAFRGNPLKAIDEYNYCKFTKRWI